MTRWASHIKIIIELSPPFILFADDIRLNRCLNELTFRGFLKKLFKMSMKCTVGVFQRNRFHNVFEIRLPCLARLYQAINPHRILEDRGIFNMSSFWTTTGELIYNAITTVSLFEWSVLRFLSRWPSSLFRWRKQIVFPLFWQLLEMSGLHARWSNERSFDVFKLQNKHSEDSRIYLCTSVHRFINACSVLFRDWPVCYELFLLQTVLLIVLFE